MNKKILNFFNKISLILVVAVIVSAVIVTNKKMTDDDKVQAASFIYENLQFTFEQLEDGTYEITGFNSTAESVTIPLNIPYGDGEIQFSSIGESAFANNTWITEIILPESITHIGNGAFSHCTNLTRVVMSDSVESIDEYAFNKCEKLKEITFFKQS